jgi:putative transposase
MMSRHTEFIKLSKEDLSSLKTLFRSGVDSNRKQTRARILDLLHKKTAPPDIVKLLGSTLQTVYNVKNRYLREGLESALNEKPRSGKPVKITGQAKAHITALACSEAPAGHARWTLRLLADKAVEFSYVEAISHNAVKEILKKTRSSPT